MSTADGRLAFQKRAGYVAALTIAISVHAEEADQNEINDEQSPGEEATPSEEEMNNLFHVYEQKRNDTALGPGAVYSQREH